MYTNLVKLGPVYTILKVFRVFKLHTTILNNILVGGAYLDFAGC